MKKLVLIAVLFIGFSWVVEAQTNPKVEAARIALITERLNLTPEQAEKFWPLYNEYTNKRRGIQQNMKQALKGIDRNNVSDEEAKKIVQLQLDRKQQELNLEKQYSERILNVISSKQMVSLRKAEQDFREIIKARIKQRQQELMRQRQQNNQKLNNRRNN
ncbi:MAG: Spy/CpxP family protein refolding chaperone [bacterium]|nr:Spy/CpxP family protein refolding chaperone [bacterium]